MRIHKGTHKDGKPVRWIETRTTWEYELHHLIDGLCSHYIRNRVEGDDPLPESLTIRKIVDTARKEYELHGTQNVWTWVEECHAMDDEDARAWAERLILAVLPGLAVPSDKES